MVQACVLHGFYMDCGFSALMIDCHSKPVHMYFFLMSTSCGSSMCFTWVLHGLWLQCINDCHSKPVHMYFFQVVAQACVLHGFYMGCGFSALIIDLNQFTCDVKKLVWLKHVFYMCFTRVVASVHELLVVINFKPVNMYFFLLSCGSSIVFLSYLK